MVKTLVVAAIMWPLLLASAAWSAAQSGTPQVSNAGAIVYLVASRVCHQRPERSFHTAGVQWPVCARCSGLYLAAPVGALAAVFITRRRRPTRARDADRPIFWLAIAALPTLTTLVLEWTHVTASGNLVRALSALPLGAAIAFVLVRTAAGAPQPIE